jgi:hypothetical protein
MSLKASTRTRASIPRKGFKLAILKSRVKLHCSGTRSLPLIVQMLNMEEAVRLPQCLDTLRFRGGPAKQILT